MTCYQMAKQFERMREENKITAEEYEKIKKQIEEHQKEHIKRGEPVKKVKILA